MTSWLAFPSPPRGNKRCIELAGTDLWITGLVNNVFVYPSDFDAVRFNLALSNTLSTWPLIAGRFIVDQGRYYIEMSDQGIPITVVENNELPHWPLGSNVVVDKDSNELQPYLDEVEATNLVGGSQDVPLFRVKLTHLLKSKEWVMGASWSHILGDADAFLQFLRAISCSYQGLELPQSRPVFKRRLWLEKEVNASLLHDIEEFLDGDRTEKDATSNQVTYEHINVCISGEKLAKLRQRISDPEVSTQDVLCAYIILTLNTLRTQNNEQLIQRANTLINYRGVSDSVASLDLIANAVLMPLSDRFEDEQSLLSIAKTIRCSIKKSRDARFVEDWVATADKVMRTIVHQNRLPKMSLMNDRIVLNSNHRFDWANLVDFGHENKCRFYTIWTRALYIRIFRLNPVYNGTQYVGKDEKGAAVAFRIETNKKKNFLAAWQRGIDEDFIHVRV